MVPTVNSLFQGENGTIGKCTNQYLCLRMPLPLMPVCIAGACGTKTWPSCDRNHKEFKEVLEILVRHTTSILSETAAL